VTGWGDFGSATRSHHEATAKKKQFSIPNEHRIFSNSSATAAKVFFFIFLFVSFGELSTLTDCSISHVPFSLDRISAN
jgi:hypothetical protein